jgi:RNA polymerase sigma factor (sigma-70 family)
MNPELTFSLEHAEPNDAELIASVRAGNQAAYGLLWNRHHQAARKLARYLGRPADADELVGEAFYRILRAITTGGGPDIAFRPYLLSTIRRLYLDNQKSAYARVRLTGDHTALDVRTAAGADDVVHEREEHDAAMRAWASMPESSRALLWHLLVEGDSRTTVARLLGTTPNGVSSRAGRAKEKLRQLFLQQHVRDATDEECRSARAQLGGYTGNAVPAKTKAEIDTHLQHCTKGCPQALAKRQDERLRRLERRTNGKER